MSQSYRLENIGLINRDKKFHLNSMELPIMDMKEIL